MNFDRNLAVLKALGNEKRLQMLMWMSDPVVHFPPQNNGDLVEDGVCVAFLTDKAGVSQPTVSSHMKVLEEAGLVTAKQIKNWVYYKPNKAAISAALNEINQEIGA